MNVRRHIRPDQVEREAPITHQVEATIGTEAMEKLSQVFGGRRLYIPREAGEHHPISVAIGRATAATLCAALGQQYVDVPLSIGKRARILELNRKGVHSRAQIAKLCGCTERHVYKVLEGQPAATEVPQQPSLFDRST